MMIERYDDQAGGILLPNHAFWPLNVPATREKPMSYELQLLYAYQFGVRQITSTEPDDTQADGVK